LVLKESEKVMIKKQANLFRGMEAVGGWLTITTERITFKPHKINIQKEPLELFINEILKIEKRNTLGIVPNGIKLTLKTGTVFNFVIWKRNKLIKFINETINN
jgi:hypothetical protein